MAHRWEGGMYQWLLFLHIGSVFGFLLAHGIHVTIMWRWRQAEDPELGLTLFNGLPQVTLTRILLATVVASGIILGFLGDWWRQGWMWFSLFLLVLMWAAMYRWGGGYFGLMGAAAEQAVEERQSGSGATESMAAYRATRLGWQPIGMMALGIGGLAAILWLMIFKPF
jgi:hypothetical protein